MDDRYRPQCQIAITHSNRRTRDIAKHLESLASLTWSRTRYLAMRMADPVSYRGVALADRIFGSVMSFTPAILKARSTRNYSASCLSRPLDSN